MALDQGIGMLGSLGFVSFPPMQELPRLVDLVANRITASPQTRLLCLSLSLADRNWNYPGTISPFWRLYVNSKDGASVYWGRPRVRHRLRGRRVHLVPAWLEFDCVNESGRDIEHFFIHFGLLGLPGRASSLLTERPVELPAQHPAEAVAAALIARCRASPKPDLAMVLTGSALVNLSIATLSERLARDGTNDAMAFENRSIAEVLRRIEAEPAKAWVNAELAEISGYSEHHFIQLFKRAAGRTPSRYVLERRVAVAAEKLVFTHLSVETIAAECGFANRFHFSRTFRSVIGTSPVAYRVARF